LKLTKTKQQKGHFEMQKIQITDRATKVIEKLIMEFKKRKIPQQEWPKVFSEAIVATSQEFWTEQIERLTPDSYFISQALQDPKMQKEFLEFMKTRANSIPKTELNSAAETLEI